MANTGSSSLAVIRDRIASNSGSFISPAWLWSAFKERVNPEAPNPTPDLFTNIVNCLEEEEARTSTSSGTTQYDPSSESPVLYASTIYMLAIIYASESGFSMLLWQYLQAIIQQGLRYKSCPWSRSERLNSNGRLALSFLVKNLPSKISVTLPVPSFWRILITSARIVISLQRHFQKGWLHPPDDTTRCLGCEENRADGMQAFSIEAEKGDMVVNRFTGLKAVRSWDPSSRF